MPELRIITGKKEKSVQFEGTPLVSEVLFANGIKTLHPCGGRGVCGKCAIKAEGNLSCLTDAEIKHKTRLACKTRLLGSASVEVTEETEGFRIETDTDMETALIDPMEGRYGAAADIGTTTVVLRLYNLKTGELLGTASALNPQRAVAADVMGRIGAALSGRADEQRSMIETTISGLLDEACRKSGTDASEVGPMVITGNTTMLYLLTGTDTEKLSHAPFTMEEGFGGIYDVAGHAAYLPPCMFAFVGADITCAILASGLTEKSGTAMLCDIGTNGETVLWKNGELFVTSTAAGPAFEGAGISCGCGSIPGAIDRVETDGGEIRVHTIDDAPATGVCGSGLIDAAAAFLQTGDVDFTGACEEDELPLENGVNLLPADIRSLQLAKAAIAAGIEIMLEQSGTKADEVTEFKIAGGFGSHLNIASAVKIGLIPEELESNAHAVGNAALEGASMLLLNRSLTAVCGSIASKARHVDLGGNPRFNERYIENMMFGEE